MERSLNFYIISCGLWMEFGCEYLTWTSTEVRGKPWALEAQLTIQTQWQQQNGFGSTSLGCGLGSWHSPIACHYSSNSWPTCHKESSLPHALEAWDIFAPTDITQGNKSRYQRHGPVSTLHQLWRLPLLKARVWSPLAIAFLLAFHERPL